jgi:putative membrane protein
MPLAATLLTVLVALLHVWFLVLEMFLWNTPYGRRVFGLTPEFATASRKLAMNQGLYNGFLAAGLIWGLAAGGELGAGVRVFFLGCVVVAGAFGAATANRKILYVQALPAALAWGATLLAG